MSDPRRYLSDDRTSPLARALLGAASSDGLDEAQVASLGRALQVESPSATAPARPAARPRLPAASTFAAVTAVAVAVAAVSLFVVRGDAPPPDPAPSVPAAVAAQPIAQRSIASVTAPPPPEAVSVDLLPEAPPLPARTIGGGPVPAGAGAHAISPPAAADDLAAEVRALERVRAALAEGRLADARAGLSGYESRFPKELLGDEARVLEIELLLAGGRRDEAEALARTFLSSSADSPYAARVRSLVSSPRVP